MIARARTSTLTSSAVAAVAGATALLVAALLGSGGSAVAQGGSRDARGGSAQAQPNIVFIYSDDQNLSDYKRRFMPRTKRLLESQGTGFSNFVVSTPLCCPSRVTYLTGQYPHNSGVFSNKHGYANMHHKHSTLPAWLGAAGYRTAFIGKFLQGYDEVAEISEPAPGWDEWAVTLEARYYGYELGVNGRTRQFGDEARAYHSDVMTRRALDFVRDNVEGTAPLFMTVNYLAPHSGKDSSGRCKGSATPAPEDRTLFRDEPLPQPPSFNEEDVNDKPWFVREKPALRDRTINRLQRKYECRLASLRDMDRGIGRIVKAFEHAEELRRTVFIFTSDNGIELGEHRLRGKGWMYEEGLHMPFLIRAPRGVLGAEAVPEVDELAGNVDLAPTILDLADAEPCLAGGRRCVRPDGRSLVPLLRGEGAWPLDRTVLVESGKGGGTCRFRGVHTLDEVYVEHESFITAEGECTQAPEDESELYDLSADPFQLENLLVTDPAKSAGRHTTLKARLEGLKHCAGESCRTAEGG